MFSPILDTAKFNSEQLRALIFEPHYIIFNLRVKLRSTVFHSFQLVTGVPATSPGSTGSGSNLSPSCGGEGGPAPSPQSRPSMTDPMSGGGGGGGQLLESSPASLAALSSYPRMPLGASMYGTSYAPTEQNPYPSLAMENSAFYGSLVSGFIFQ